MVLFIRSYRETICYVIMQDAHEFLNFLLNELVDILEKEHNAVKDSPETSSPPDKIPNGPRTTLVNGGKKEPVVTWVHKNFQVNQFRPIPNCSH